LQNILYTQPLSIQDLGLSLILGSLVFVAIEIEKWLVRRSYNAPVMVRESGTN
jgi:hypothetical protein